MFPFTDTEIPLAFSLNSFPVFRVPYSVFLSLNRPRIPFSVSLYLCISVSLNLCISVSLSLYLYLSHSLSLSLSAQTIRDRKPIPVPFSVLSCSVELWSSLHCLVKARQNGNSLVHYAKGSSKPRMVVMNME